MTPFTRRSLFKSAAATAFAAAMARSKPAFADATDKSAVLVIFTTYGFNALFASADSFVSANTFGCTGDNTLQLGGTGGPNGLVVDKATFGSLDAFATGHMAAVGIAHGMTAHEAAEPALWSNGRSYPTVLARELGGDAPIKAAVVGGAMPQGTGPTEGDVSLQGITDMKATLITLGVPLDPSVPDRKIATNAMLGATTMSHKRLLRSPSSLRSVKDGLTTGVSALQHDALSFDYAGLCTAYGVAPGTTGVSDFNTQMMAAELMISAGANVVAAVDNGPWDSHGDLDGTVVRTGMVDRVMQGLATFTSRMLNAQGRNVTVAIIGDFSRSLPGSDHQGNLTALVMGKNVAVGTTGRVGVDVSLPAGPSINEFWAYLAAVSRCPTQPFGTNPHTSLVVPT
jgi:hypothetical protein